MRRSFRVAWRPDGSFLQIDNNNLDSQTLKQSRPDIPNAGTALFETHRKHTVIEEVEDEIQDETPIFTLPKGINASLGNALNDFATTADLANTLSRETRQVVSNSFSLLTTLYSKGDLDESRRLEALSNWLRMVVSCDTANAVSSALSRGRTAEAIFMAISGGDVSTASSLALKSGSVHLSLMLANTGNHGQEFLRTQLDLWSQSGANTHCLWEITRILGVHAGKLDIEEHMFSNNESYDVDWRRRLGMKFWFSHGSVPKQTINQYASDVSAGIAPPALPVYSGLSRTRINSSNKRDQCILFQMLRRYAGDTSVLSETVSPITHTADRNDFSASFHLSAAISAMGLSSLSPVEENLIVDSVGSQLISAGRWEWAVYSQLCSIGGVSITGALVESRKRRAKNIVIQFFDPSSDSLAAGRRTFLEDVGVPSEWFNEALSYRCAYSGDVFEYVNNTLSFSAESASAASEKLLVPHFLLEGSKQRRNLRSLLEHLGKFSDEGSKPDGCDTTLRFLELVDRVEAISNMSQTDIAEIEDLIMESSELSFLFKEVGQGSKTMLKVPYEVTTVPQSIYVVEAVATLSVLAMQLNAIKTGSSTIDYKDDSGWDFKHTTSLLSTDGLFGSSSMPVGSEAFIRGMTCVRTH